MIRLTLGRLLVVIGLIVPALGLRAQSGTGSLEFDFAAPTGYVVQYRQGSMFIDPKSPADPQTPCAYGLGPPRPSTGRLEADAEAALLESTAGWQHIGDHRIGMRGVTAAGWSYVLSGGDFRGQVAGGMSFLTTMAMVFPASGNRVNVVLGFGDVGRCTFSDVAFAQLVHSLRPRGWSAPGMNPLEQELIGTWEGSTLSGHTFYGNGRHSRTASGVVFDEARSVYAEGRYALRGSEVTITRAGKTPERIRVQVYDKWNHSRWERTLAVLYDDDKPPYLAEYVRRAR